MGSKFGKIGLGTNELAALERLEKWEKCDLSNTFIFGWIFFILADNKTSHKRSEGVEFRQDSITDFGVSFP